MDKSSDGGDSSSMGDLSDASRPPSIEKARVEAAIESVEQIYEADGSVLVLFSEGRSKVDVDTHLPPEDDNLGSGPPGVGVPASVEAVDILVETLAHRYGLSRHEILEQVD